jgi:hypothetical protein
MNSRKWIDSHGAIYDSYDSSYMIFVNKNSDFNFLKTTEFEHIALIKDEKRIKSFVKFCERTGKMLIYVKRSNQKDVLFDVTTQNYIVINYNSKKISDEFEDNLSLILKSRIVEIEQLNKISVETIKKKDESDEDEDIDMTNVESI